MPPRVVVVGLGPAGADLVLPAARDAFERIEVRFVRTARHPAVQELAAAGVAFTTFDERYDHADDLDAVYQGIADALVRAAIEHGEVVYGVPGNPAVAEHTVVLLREAARTERSCSRSSPASRSRSWRGTGWASIHSTRAGSSTPGRSATTSPRPGGRCSWPSATRGSCSAT